MDHDYEVPQQKGLKKICSKVKWTREEVIPFFFLYSDPYLIFLAHEICYYLVLYWGSL